MSGSLEQSGQALGVRMPSKISIGIVDKTFRNDASMS